MKVKISSGYVINLNQSDWVAQKFTGGFLKLSNSKWNKLEFKGPTGISLYDRLKSPLSKYEFFFIMKQIVDVVQKIRKMGLSCNNLVLDLKYVFFNDLTKELSFIYLPIATPHGNVSILSFVEQIIYSVKPEQNDTNYLAEFNSFIKKYNEFDSEKVENYICGNMSKQVENVRTDDATELMSEDDDATEIFQDDDVTEIFQDVDSTEIFQVDEEKTNISAGMQAVNIYPMLIRATTEEIIRINKPVFRIGTEEECVDYMITNNGAVSRSHADIISRGERYFVFDLRSKNRSYINNRVLPAEYEVEIVDGDVLKLANEEFLFRA